MRRTCQIAECDLPVHGHGYCGVHYKRWKRHGDPLAITNYGLDFWDRVDKSGTCWTWTGFRDPFGYGRVRGVRYGLGPVPALTHRVSWLLEHGTLDAQACVLHRCDNPPCVRPDHLFLGTRADNTADMMSKGRGKAGARPFESRTHGTRNAHAKMTEDSVVEMRRRAAAGEPTAELAHEYGISASRARAIILGQGWRHVWPYR